MSAGAKRSRLSGLYRWLAHPLLIAVCIALIAKMSGRFIAAKLVSRSSAVPHADQRAFNDGYRAWTTSNASIGAKIQAYFGNNLGVQWRSFAHVVTDYFQLSARPESGRAEQVQDPHVP